MNKKLVCLVLSLLMVLSLMPGFAAESQDPVYDVAYAYFENFPSDRNVIQTADLLPRIDAQEDMYILDIRRAEDYANGHLTGAVNLPFFDKSIPENLANIPDDRPVYVYCYTGQTSSQTTALLNLAGKMAKNIQSGFDNGISQTEGYEAYITQDAVAVEPGTYSFDEAVAVALDAYFTDKMTKDGTPIANYNITPAAVKEIVDNADESYYLLSVRRAEDFAAGHITGAVNIPFGLGMQEGLAALPKDQIIIVYCYTGQTASQVVGVLRLMGYEAYNLSGGMGAEGGAGWLGAGYEVVQ
jgi:rhodanese-related sulfurtransferase